VPVSPQTLDGLTSGPARVIRSGRQLAALERSGCVRRSPEPQDGRASLVQLTDEGPRALAVTRDLRARWAGATPADRDEDDARLLSGLLERLATGLDRAPTAVPTAVP
jgi:DNA-binding MarR family transcriptional regulator